VGNIIYVNICVYEYIYQQLAKETARARASFVQSPGGFDGNSFYDRLSAGSALAASYRLGPAGSIGGGFGVRFSNTTAVANPINSRGIGGNPKS